MSAPRWEDVRPFVTHPTVLGVGALAAGLAAATGPRLLTPTGIASVAAGAALFVPQEYVNHRFLLHRPPSGVPLIRRMQERTHFRHHDDPDDLRFVFGPLWGILPQAALYWLLYLAATGRLDVATLMLAGGLAAYVLYEWTHYVAHSPIQPLTRWGRRMKAMHLWHHHRNEFHWFGVTTPAADHLAGTHGDPKVVPQSATARNIRESFAEAPPTAPPARPA